MLSFEQRRSDDRSRRFGAGRRDPFCVDPFGDLVDWQLVVRGDERSVPLTVELSESVNAREQSLALHLLS
ncbi:hypothetical protein [Halobaculum gomorrense]|nr:hypothetical protein [Halobaculum gomorrense]